MLERVSQTIELPRTGGPGTGLGGAWKVIVRNDDHNTFDHVARTLARVIPGVTMALTLFSLNFLGDGLRDALDPQMRTI